MFVNFILYSYSHTDKKIDRTMTRNFLLSSRHPRLFCASCEIAAVARSEMFSEYQEKGQGRVK